MNTNIKSEVTVDNTKTVYESSINVTEDCITLTAIKVTIGGNK